MTVTLRAETQLAVEYAAQDFADIRDVPAFKPQSGHLVGMSEHVAARIDIEHGESEPHIFWRIRRRMPVLVDPSAILVLADRWFPSPAPPAAVHIVAGWDFPSHGR